VPSTIGYDELYIMIAGKLRCSPSFLCLQYWLESDKPKTGAVSIQSDDELVLFEARMRPLIVPQRLPSGKISTRSLKPVSVFFEDATTANATANAKTAKNAGKKVCF
jgi:hypothetical protein